MAAGERGDMTGGESILKPGKGLRLECPEVRMRVVYCEVDMAVGQNKTQAAPGGKSAKNFVPKKHFVL